MRNLWYKFETEYEMLKTDCPEYQNMSFAEIPLLHLRGSLWDAMRREEQS